MIIFPSFLERVGSHVFRQPSSVVGYLAQLNEWAKADLVWVVERIGGEDHIPVFKAVPIYQGERLEVFAAFGPSKKAAMEEAARLMAESGSC